MNGIAAKDISVLIQGNICRETRECIESIKKFLPEAEIIISTWQQCVTDFEECKVVKLDDPGYIEYNSLANTNRQLVGRKEGLKYCNGKYTLIIRSDSKILNLNFIKMFREKLLRGQSNKYRFLQERVVICSASKIENALYFLCDWFFFGLTDDLKSPKYSTPHEYLGYSFAENNISSFCYDYGKLKSSEEVQRWKCILLENFITLGFYKNYGIVNLKQPYYSNQIKNSKFTYSAIHHLALNFEFEDWVDLYNKMYMVKFRCRKRITWRLSKITLKCWLLIKQIRN